MSIDLGLVSDGPAPGPPSRKRRMWIWAGAAGIAVVAAASIATVASAQLAGAPAQTPSPSAAASGAPAMPKRVPGPAMRGGFGPGLGAALHGEYVIAKPGGGYQTIDTQQGQVTAVSSGSITVKSSDGFTKSYTVTASTLVDAQRDGIGSIKVGDTVSVNATVSGGTTTATDIRDGSQIRAAHPKPSAS